jgi:hypothetical protein
MTFSDEVLMAYADDELDPRTRAAVEAAMASDPDIARRVEQHKALRGKLRSAFDQVLDEPVPDRLIAVARTAPAVRREGNVIPLRRKSPPRWSWPQWGAIAASLLIGVFLGQAWLRSTATGPITSHDGQLLASGMLERALSTQLASEQPPSSPVQIGVSFRAKSGDYCRTFAVRDASALAGLACRNDDQWRVQVLAKSDQQATPGTRYRQAGSAMPRTVLQAVEDQIAGEPLDAHGEEAARSKQWKH